MQMFYEGMVAINKLTTDNIDLMAIPDAELRRRWASLFSCFAYLVMDNFRELIPSDWLGEAAKLRSESFADYRARVIQYVTRLPKAEFAEKTIGMLKVRIFSLL